LDLEFVFGFSSTHVTERVTAPGHHTTPMSTPIEEQHGVGAEPDRRLEQQGVGVDSGRCPEQQDLPWTSCDS
jgi:hypothetical protein